MEPHIGEETRLNRSMIEAGEGSPTFRDEILPLDILQPAAALTPVLQSLGSGSKRKRTPTREGTTCTKKAAVDTDTRRPARSAPAAKKKATVDTGTGRPAPSATLLPPPPKVPSPTFPSFSDPYEQERERGCNGMLRKRVLG